MPLGTLTVNSMSYNSFDHAAVDENDRVDDLGDDPNSTRPIKRCTASMPRNRVPNHADHADAGQAHTAKTSKSGVLRSSS